MSKILNTDLREIMGLDALPPDEQRAMVEQVGTMILEAALLRLTNEFSEAELTAFTAAQEKFQAGDEYLEYLNETYPQFKEYMQAETIAFKKQIIDVLGTPEMQADANQELENK